MNARYEAYLTSEEWQSRRCRIFHRDNSRCVLCNRPAACIHHRTYQRITRESDEDLVSLCEDCHSLFHQNYQSRHTHHVPSKLSDIPPMPIKSAGDRDLKVNVFPETHLQSDPPKIKVSIKNPIHVFFVQILEKKGAYKNKRPSFVFARKVISHPSWNEIRGQLLASCGTGNNFKDVKKIFHGSAANLIQTSSEAGCFSSLWSIAMQKLSKTKS